MTTEEFKVHLQDILPAIQGFLQGKSIQEEEGEGKWRNVTSMEWLYTRKYRIEPEPLVIWAYIRDDREGEDKISCPYISESTARARAYTGRLAKFIEVPQ